MCGRVDVRMGEYANPGSGQEYGKTGNNEDSCGPGHHFEFLLLNSDFSKKMPRLGVSGASTIACHMKIFHANRLTTSNGTGYVAIKKLFFSGSVSNWSFSSSVSWSFSSGINWNSRSFYFRRISCRSFSFFVAAVASCKRYRYNCQS